MTRSTGLAAAALVAASHVVSAQNVVRYEPTERDYKYVYATLPPVAVLKPGEILETRTADCFGDAIRKPGDTLAMAKGDNPLTGPFAVAGAEPGDTLVVKILDLKVDSTKGLGALAPGFGALNSTSYTPMLNGRVPEKIWFYDIDHASNTATYHALDSTYSVQIQMQPFLGCIDVPEIRPGFTLYLPVNAKDALLYIGDGHAAQGDGEVAGTAIEVPMRVRLQVDLVKRHSIAWPRLESDTALITVGAYRPLDDALRIAFTELVGWIHADYRLSELDAYELLSKVARIRVAEMVDPNYVILASIDKKYLPPR
jgi:amidase